MSETTNTKSQIDPSQKKALLAQASETIRAFIEGLAEFEPGQLASDDDEYGFTFFDGYMVYFTRPYLEAKGEFTRLAARVLKARAAHEPTIGTLVQKAAQGYVVAMSSNGGDDSDEKILKDATQSLVNVVLEELSKVHMRIEANFLVAHDVFSGIINLGRVRIMTTQDAAINTPPSNITKIRLVPGEYPKETVDLASKTYSVGMPRMVWVVDVPATKENVPEETKWLIDVAVSFMRLSSRHWSVRYPKPGDIEPHPTLPVSLGAPHVTFFGDVAFTGGKKLPGIYDINNKVAKELQSVDCQQRAAILFDPPNKSLAMRVAQGLGWLTRGRQVTDRAERLLSFFTALEALLTSNEKNDPVTQTIARHVSVIQNQKIADRVQVYNRVKSLYGLRSAVVHSGKREVLWQDVNTLQRIAEAVYGVVLHRCDLSMSQDKFAQSLSEASHGLPWEFAKPVKSSKKKAQPNTKS
ncbi:HEPN domain-containing protein [Agrobacterium tumefaciens]|uniref:HEPN domain-containing protein n=1 Tax=Agrobacterium tumefaciens TaxID=358 RepID=UPI000552FBE8|nr:HEPN domain-containing protein [Agrobacterium tumefaciens]